LSSRERAAELGSVRAALRSPAVGCDVGGTAVKLVRLAGGRVADAELFSTPRGSAGEVLAALAGRLRAVVERAARNRGGRGRVATGIALPGFLDPARRKVIRLSNLPALDGVAFAPRIESLVPGARVCLDADTNAGGVAEALLGAGRGRERVLYLTLGTGLGAALVVEGVPVRVSRNTVGQVAHVRLTPPAPGRSAAPTCRCGGHGCAESLLSASGILERARAAGIARARNVEELAALGRKSGRSVPGRRARRLWDETGDFLGGLCQTLASLFAPDIVVIGGGIAGAADLWIDRVRDAVAASGPALLGQKIAVEPARLGRFAGALGAALLAARDASQRRSARSSGPSRNGKAVPAVDARW
jgi:glucokinase